MKWWGCARSGDRRRLWPGRAHTHAHTPPAGGRTCKLWPCMRGGRRVQIEESAGAADRSAGAPAFASPASRPAQPLRVCGCVTEAAPAPRSPLPESNPFPPPASVLHVGLGQRGLGGRLGGGRNVSGHALERAARRLAHPGQLQLKRFLALVHRVQAERMVAGRGGGVVGAAWAGHGGAGRAGVARSQRRPACALSPLQCAHPSHPSPSTPPPLFHAHFGDLHHALGACQLAELEALDLGLGGLPALAHGGAVVFLRDGWVWERVWTGAGRQQQRRASTPRARLGLVARASHTHFHPPTPPLSTPLPPPIQHVRERRPTGRPRRERGPRHRIRRRHRTRRSAGWTQRGGRTSKD